MVFACSVAFCKKPDKSCHRFPKDPGVRQKWIAVCNRAEEINLYSGRVCARHFRPEDYERDLMHEIMNLPTRRILKADAVPSLNLIEGVEEFSMADKIKETRPARKPKVRGRRKASYEEPEDEQPNKATKLAVKKPVASSQIEARRTYDLSDVALLNVLNEETLTFAENIAGSSSGGIQIFRQWTPSSKSSKPMTKLQFQEKPTSFRSSSSSAKVMVRKKKIPFDKPQLVPKASSQISSADILVQGTLYHNQKREAQEKEEVVVIARPVDSRQTNDEPAQYWKNRCESLEHLLQLANNKINKLKRELVLLKAASEKES